MRGRPWPIPPRPPTCRPTAPSSCAACAFATATAARGCSTAPTCASLPGRAVALLGPSGCGKTTLAELLVRFRDPVAGDVTLGGVAVRDAAQDDLRAAVCLGAQEAHLFAGTLAENLALARPGATPAELERALARVGLGPWLESLPDGLATTVGEHGAKVSGGQRRRIAAARLLLSPARFLIADEPAAHLDADGAAALIGELAREARRGSRRARHHPRAARSGVLRQSVHLARRAARLG